MNQSEEIKHLSDAVAGLASTLTEIIDQRIREMNFQSPTAPRPSTLQNSQDRYLRKKDLAVHFQVNLRTIDNWMAARYLPYFKIGRKVLFKLSDIEGMWNERFKVQERRRG